MSIGDHAIELGAVPLEADRQLRLERRSYIFEGPDCLGLDSTTLDPPDPPARDATDASKIGLAPASPKSERSDRDTDTAGLHEPQHDGVRLSASYLNGSDARAGAPNVGDRAVSEKD